MLMTHACRAGLKLVPLDVKWFWFYLSSCKDIIRNSEKLNRNTVGHSGGTVEPHKNIKPLAVFILIPILSAFETILHTVLVSLSLLNLIFNLILIQTHLVTVRTSLHMYIQHDVTAFPYYQQLKILHATNNKFQSKVLSWNLGTHIFLPWIDNIISRSSILCVRL